MTAKIKPAVLKLKLGDLITIWRGVASCKAILSRAEA